MEIKIKRGRLRKIRLAGSGIKVSVHLKYRNGILAEKGLSMGDGKRIHININLVYFTSLTDFTYPLGLVLNSRAWLFASGIE